MDSTSPTNIQFTKVGQRRTGQPDLVGVQRNDALVWIIDLLRQRTPS